MVSDLSQLMRASTEHAPPDDHDLTTVVRSGRRRVRFRRAGVAGGTTLLAAAVTMGSLWWLNPSPPDLDAAGVPKPEGAVLHLSDAQQAAAGKDYRVLTSYTNENLDADNGQYLDGVTDDGLVLFRDGPRMDQLRPRFALMDPRTGQRDWLPDLDIGQTQTWPLELGEDRLVLLGTSGNGLKQHLVTYTFDRVRGQWTGMKWRDLPAVESPFGAVLGPDDRLYVPVPATQAEPPAGGWPTGPDGEADDADAEGDTYHLWSASLTDGTDVRDEGLTVGELAFTDHSMVWTDSTNGDAGKIHVRDLASGAVHSFDPQAGERCNLLSFGATDDRVVLGEYCGTYADGVRDDRVQILSTDGEQIVTVQDSDIEGGLGEGSDVVTVNSYQRGQAGTYAYDLATERFLRVSDGLSQWGFGGGPTGDPAQFFWHTPSGRHGATQWLGELLP